LVSGGNRSLKFLNVSKFTAPDIKELGDDFKLNVSLPIFIKISDVVGDVVVIGVEVEDAEGGLPAAPAAAAPAAPAAAAPAAPAAGINPVGGGTGVTVSIDGFLANKSFTVVSDVTRPFSIILNEPGSPASAANVK
jgi:hypothetical protein